MKREQKEATSALVKLSRQYGIEEQKLIDTLKSTVIKPKKIRGKDGKPDTWQEASTAEVNAFLMVAAQYDLDPMLKQIHAFVSESGGGIVPIVGYDGWVKLVNREKRFAGIEFIDHLDEKNNLYAITGKMKIFNDPGGKPEHGTREVEVTEYLEECRGTTTPWTKWPRRMLRNKVYSQTARMAFGFSGIYDEDEGDRIIEAGEAIDITPTKIPAALPAPQKPVTSGATEGQKPEKIVDAKTHEDAPGSTKSASPQGSAETAGDLARAAASPQPATGAAETPRTDQEKKAYILSVATAAATRYNITVGQVIFDLSKFMGKTKDTPPKDIEVGAQGIDDPRLVGRWLNKTYGEAKKLEAVLDAESPL
jgi:phage recombination protein Bet